MKIRSYQTSRRGFTLIELIVVIAIIGVLLSISLAGIGNARVRSRDARRIADIRTIQSALEMHAVTDPSRSYPPSSAAAAVTQKYCTTGTPGKTNYGVYDNECFAKYLATTPMDPNGKVYDYYRPACLTKNATTGLVTMSGDVTCSGTKATGYGLHATLEAENNEARNDASPTDAMSYDIMQ